MAAGGYIKIWRKIKSHPYWKEPRKFSKFEAWMDLVMTAAGLDFEVPYRDQVIKLKRGQMIIAERKLAERWGWSRERVHRFLANCVHNEEIQYHRQDHRFSIISIVKYSTYNPPAAPRGPAGKTTDKTTGKTTDKTTGKTNINKEERSIKRSINKETGQDLTKEMLQLFEKEFKRFWDEYDPRGKRNKDYAKKRFMALCKAGQLSEFDKGFTGYSNFLKHQRNVEGFDQRPKYFSTLISDYKEYIGFEYKPPM